MTTTIPQYVVTEAGIAKAEELISFDRQDPIASILQHIYLDGENEPSDFYCMVEDCLSSVRSLAGKPEYASTWQMVDYTLRHAGELFQKCIDNGWLVEYVDPNPPINIPAFRQVLANFASEDEDGVLIVRPLVEAEYATNRVKAEIFDFLASSGAAIAVHIVCPHDRRPLSIGKTILFVPSEKWAVPDGIQGREVIVSPAL